MSRGFWAIIGTGNSLGVLIVALAAFMVTGTSSVNARLDSMDARFASIANRFHDISARLLRIESSLAGVNICLGRVEGRLQIAGGSDLDETEARP